jgi:hypothetical protein
MAAINTLQDLIDSGKVIGLDVTVHIPPYLSTKTQGFQPFCRGGE